MTGVDRDAPYVTMSLPPREPLTDAEIDALEAALRETVIEWPEYGEDNPSLSWSVEDRHAARLIADLRATRAELAHLRGVVRDAVELLRDEATFWHELYPAWLVHALLGEDAAITKQWNGVNNLNMARQRKAIRALVAAAGEDSDA